MKRLVVLCLCICLISFAGAVYASPITFDLSGSSSSNSYHQQLEFSVAGIDLEVQAYLAEDPYTSGLREDITQTSSGLGVYSGGSDNKHLDDSYSKVERLNLLFSQNVSLLEVGFTYADADDQFSLLVNGADFLIDKAADSWQPAASLEGRRFSFSIADNSDDWRLKFVAVEEPAPAPEPAVPTPEPATWLLLGSGLGGLVYWRKKTG